MASLKGAIYKKRQFGICKLCHKKLPRSKMLLTPQGYLRKHCKKCNKEYLRTLPTKNRNRIYRAYKADLCAICGFKGEPIQLDVNHIDGNRNNNQVDNLQTLCANCHRLVTHHQRRG